jgi:hypothetical protein
LPESEQTDFQKIRATIPGMDGKPTGTAMRQLGSMTWDTSQSNQTASMDNHRVMKSQIRQEIKSRQGVFIARDRMALSPIKQESRAILDSQMIK